ncbi:MAG TPA: nuclear transport factor 2 family protein [Rhodanobacteraceae bacterium]|nr:nuclear transport factor 2 family protein [Rhodanobacteraceae bacterium]
MGRLLRGRATHAVVALAACIAGCATVPDRAADERYIVESEHAWAESVATGDTSTIERILADDFIGVDPKGKMYDKAEMVRDTREAPKYFASNHVNAVKVRFYGDTAVAQGDESWVKRADGARGRFVWTDTWVRRNGRWQIVAAEDLVAPDVDAAR